MCYSSEEENEHCSLTSRGFTSQTGRIVKEMKEEKKFYRSQRASFSSKTATFLHMEIHLGFTMESSKRWSKPKNCQPFIRIQRVYEGNGRLRYGKGLLSALEKEYNTKYTKIGWLKQIRWHWRSESDHVPFNKDKNNVEMDHAQSSQTWAFWHVFRKLRP